MSLESPIPLHRSPDVDRSTGTRVLIAVLLLVLVTGLDFLVGPAYDAAVLHVFPTLYVARNFERFFTLAWMMSSTVLIVGSALISAERTIELGFVGVLATHGVSLLVLWVVGAGAAAWKEAYIRVSDSEQKYYDFYENSPGMYCSVDPETAKVLDCNLTLADKLGRTKEEIIGKPIYDVYHPESLEAVRIAFREFVSTGRVSGAELKLKRVDGSCIDVMLNVTSRRNDRGDILYSRSTWTDIGALKTAENRLKIKDDQLVKQRSLLDLILSNMNEGVCVITPDGRFAFANPAADSLVQKKIFDTSLEDWVLMKPDKRTLIPPKEFPAVRALRGEEIHGEVVCLKTPNLPDGVVISCDLFPVFDKDKEVSSVVLVFRDVPEQGQDRPG